jgi:diguanylate cyclase (GGDEF)-like protein/PAS domain S-box-containing protein
MKKHNTKHLDDESFAFDSNPKDSNHLSQLLLNASLNSQKDIIILAIDRDYKYYFFNDKHRLAMKAYYGVDVEVGMSILDAITTDIDKENSRINYGKAMDGESHITIQTFGDLNVSTFETVYSPLVNPQGEIVGATAYARDVSERIKAEQQLKASEEEHRLLIEAMNQGIAIHEVIWDDHGKPVDYRYLSVNAYYEQMTGLKREAIIGKKVSEILPFTEQHWWDAFAKVAVTRKPQRVINHSAELGKYYSISFYSPKPNQVAGIVDDLTDLIEIKQQLIESDSRYEMLAEQSGTVVWEVDLEGTILYISYVVEKLLGYPPSELLGTSIMALEAVDDRDNTPKLSLTTTKAIERQLTHKAHHRLWVETYVVSVVDASGNVIKYRGSDIDITERKRREAEILYANTHDHLTRLYNRRYFDQALSVADRPENTPLTLIMADLNGLKLINDAFGHGVGDTMLIDISSQLQTQFGSLGTVARIGGDEFCILLPNTSTTEARQHVKDVKRRIESGKILGVKRSISFGVATKTKEMSISALLISAEDDMYARKLL